MDTLPPEDIERETLWHLYVDLLQDYEVLQEEKSRLWDIIQRNMQSHSDELEKMRVGFLTILAKMEHQEGVIAQMQLELNSYREAKTRNTKHENFAFRLSSGSAPEESAVDTKTRKPQEKFSTSVKIKQVIEYHDMYAGQTQFEVAKHFNITIRTLQNYLRKAGVTWKQVGE